MDTIITLVYFVIGGVGVLLLYCIWFSIKSCIKNSKPEHNNLITKQQSKRRTNHPPCEFIKLNHNYNYYNNFSSIPYYNSNKTNNQDEYNRYNEYSSYNEYSNEDFL